MNELSIYLHIPFCVRRCGYCDFNTYAGMAHLMPRYVEALAREIEFYGRLERMPVKTVYFGGGTPSLLAADQFERLFKAIHGQFELVPDAEITIEANPGRLSAALLAAIKDLGVNRISLGVQSSNPNELQALDRLHGYPEAVEAVTAARKAGFDNLSMDLIFGIPQQTMQSWGQSLEDVLALQPEHLSLYSLTVEEGTPLARHVAAGKVSVPEDDLAADMFELAEDRLGAAGFGHYEISNWAKDRDGKTLLSQHNRQYWLNQPYLGLGAGAHGFVRQTRYENASGLVDYIRRMSSTQRHDQLFSPVAEEFTEIDRFREMQETMMMGLRLLREGVSAARFSARFGVEMEDVFSAEIEQFLVEGLTAWIDQPGKALRLTERGTLLGNRVFGAFV